MGLPPKARLKSKYCFLFFYPRFVDRPKLIFANASNPSQPTHLFNGVSPVYGNASNGANPCAMCGGVCVDCKVYTRAKDPRAPHDLDWTYTLLRPLKAP